MNNNASIHQLDGGYYRCIGDTNKNWPRRKQTQILSSSSSSSSPLPLEPRGRYFWSDETPHRTAPDPKILGEEIDQTAQRTYRWLRYTIEEGGRTLIFNSHPGMNWKYAVRTNNSALTPPVQPSGEIYTTFILPHRTPKPLKTTAPDPKTLGEGSPLPFHTMVNSVP